ncbi:PIN domain nuclease [Flavobacterium cyanobacteriorum]|uniref:PIN domain nuclease n=1 Tax=Flavobacterium cyanobacteriorum TaxID=2022802 RepID=A0A255YVB0_9FLAO|nr:PIN domain-containing protein [Flavobacterium cyanobacteriorum]OYQ33153.1 PIN domain nuclease [Flavobacterium cyanobacteriorum]
MDKLLVDTNIVLDLLTRREEFYKEAQDLFTLSDKGQVELYISSLTLANTYYLISRQFKASEARKILIRFKVLVKVLAMDDKIMELALASDFNDFEDAIQYYTAIENNLNIIITRNKKDFKLASIPVFSAKEYLAK